MIKDIITELAEAVISGSFTPQSVWEDYYKNWSEAKQEAFDMKLLAVIIHADRASDEYMNANACYDFLSRMRTAVTDKREEQETPKAKRGNRNNKMHDYFKNHSDMETVLNDIPKTTDNLQLADYFEDFVFKGVMTDIPSAGALKEYGIIVADSWKSLVSSRRSKRN